MQGSVSNSKPGFMASMQNFFTASNMTRKLYALRQSSENDDWAEKAIEVVVKKLKQKNGALQNLEFALNNPGLPSNCVTITRSLDGRLQILHKKGLPHVIFCRLWRWPDLKSHHELQAIRECEYPFSKRLHEVCINPYHYVRLLSGPLPPIEVPLSSPATPELMAPMSSSSPAQQPHQSYQGVNQMAHFNYQGTNQMGGSAPSPIQHNQNSNFQYFQGMDSIEAMGQNFLNTDFPQIEMADQTPQNAVVPQVDNFEYFNPSPHSNSSYSSQGYHSASPPFSPSSCQDYQEFPKVSFLSYFTLLCACSVENPIRKNVKKCDPPCLIKLFS